MLVIFKSVTYEVSKLDWNEVKAKFCLTDNHEMRLEAQFHSNDGKQVVLTANCPLTFNSLKLIPSARLHNIIVQSKRLRRKRKRDANEANREQELQGELKIVCGL